MTISFLGKENLHFGDQTAQAAQHEDSKGVLALLFVMVVVVTTLILHLWIDQNEHTEQVQENIFMPKPREVTIDIPNLVSLPAPPSMSSHRQSNNFQDAISPNPTIETSSGSLKLIPMITHEERVEIDMPSASSSLPLAYPLLKNSNVPKTGTCSSGPSQIYQVKEIVDLPCEQLKVDTLHPVSPVAPILGKTPHLYTSTSLVGTSQSLADEAVNNTNVVVRDQSQVDMSDTASLLHQDPTPAEATSSFGIEKPNIGTPHLYTSTSLVGTSQSLADEVVNNANAAVRDQSHVDMSDTASLLHQDPTPAGATSSFGIENPINLSPEVLIVLQAEQTSGVLSQSTAQTTPEVPVPEAVEPDLKIEMKVATSVIIISAGGIVAVISGVIGNEKALLPRKLLFKGFISLNYIALVSGIGLFILIKISPNIPGFARIAKFIMWFDLGSLVYSLGMATCIMFPAKAEIVLILVVPLVLVGLVGILRFARRE